MRMNPSWPLTLSIFCLASCSRSEPARDPGATALPAAAPLAKQAEPPKPSIDDTTFRLSLTGPQEYAAGAASSVELTLEARGGYHVNQDYPIRVDVKAPAAVKLAKATFGRPDATEFGEQQARFALPFSAEKGTHDLTATVDFAVCTKETCVPDQRTVAVPVSVR